MVIVNVRFHNTQLIAKFECSYLTNKLNRIKSFAIFNKYIKVNQHEHQPERNGADFRMPQCWRYASSYVSSAEGGMQF